MNRITEISEEDELKPLIMQRADPYVYLHHDGYYYFTASVPEYDRIELRRAWSVKALPDAAPEVIWRKHAEGEMSWHIWAPELHFIDGSWYIYFAAGRADDTFKIRTYILENKSPDPFCGEWKEKGMLKSAWDSFMLDCTVFEHDGKWYAVWAQKAPDAADSSRIYIAALKNPWTLETEPIELSRPEFNWECRGFMVNEGPAVLKTDGKIIITYSASATDASYCMGFLSADDTSDILSAKNWKKSPMPIMTTDETKGIFGPGHNSFTKSRDGRENYMIYHARPYAEVDLNFALFDPNRHTWIKKIGNKFFE